MQTPTWLTDNKPTRSFGRHLKFSAVDCKFKQFLSFFVSAKRFCRPYAMSAFRLSAKRRCRPIVMMRPNCQNSVNFEWQHMKESSGVLGRTNALFLLIVSSTPALILVSAFKISAALWSASGELVSAAL